MPKKKTKSRKEDYDRSSMYMFHNERYENDAVDSAAKFAPIENDAADSTA